VKKEAMIEEKKERVREVQMSRGGEEASTCDGQTAGRERANLILTHISEPRVPVRKWYL
jgi:hypothetical protein